MTDEMRDIEDYAVSLRTEPLGELVDVLFVLRLEDWNDESLDPIVKSSRILRIDAVKKEISRRQVSREDVNTRPGKGVTTLGSLV